MKYAPRKVFILENGEYIEISYEELCRREEADPSYKDKLFIPLHGMIMEVTEAFYREFYKAKDRDEYLTWRTKHKDVSYSQFDDDECSGEDMLVAHGDEIADVVMWQVIKDKLRLVLPLLPKEEQELIDKHFYQEIPQTKLAEQLGISQQAVSKRIRRICAKIKKLIEN